MTYIRLAFVALTCAVLRHARAQTPETFRERMYHRLSNNAPCWTLLDQHGEVGCRSQDMSGVSAVVRYIRDDEDVNNYMGECAIYDGVGRCRGEYAVVLESSLIFADTFSDMVDCPCTSSLHVLHPQTLINKTNTDGDVTETNQAANNSEADGSRANNQQEEVSEFPEHTHPGFSPAEKSPNAIYGLYHDKPDKQVLWNAGGGAQERTMLNKPITLVTNGDDITYLRKHARNGREVNKLSLLNNSVIHDTCDADAIKYLPEAISHSSLDFSHKQVVIHSCIDFQAVR
ncbi:hypothetical protein SARC_00370 [Sphaeroforma arctica JP610]|uniref:Uncharacterized protein n=1 Tax=Sphaeroforma arctica JP610 TaxID=667725 RepID=A0A0L0GFA7_9EUKA|nr:hypothetical protein SARC_00370 [Sphaeroforma arctica JP610]KNC87546.1 hypothetical protein SARC_00370 [Sphaeroforma arctica JP610]|eukprot:XP_014161448.1 hypothetical protein SARC_00370 [Sphaeroforma arctica JP610]